MRRAVQLLFTGAAKLRAGIVGLRCWLVALLDSSRSVAAVWKSLKRPQRAEPDGTQNPTILSAAYGCNTAPSGDIQVCGEHCASEIESPPFLCFVHERFLFPRNPK